MYSDLPLNKPFTCSIVFVPNSLNFSMFLIVAAVLYCPSPSPSPSLHYLGMYVAVLAMYVSVVWCMSVWYGFLGLVSLSFFLLCKS